MNQSMGDQWDPHRSWLGPEWEHAAEPQQTENGFSRTVSVNGDVARRHELKYQQGTPAACG